ESLVGWSPDGRKLAFTRALSGGLFVANADGSAVKRIATAGEAAWSPVGARLASAERNGIWIVGDDGTGRRRVARGGYALSWAPDGTRLAFIAEGLHVVAVDGGAPRLVVPGTADVRAETWS